MGFLSRVLGDSINFHRAVGRGIDDLARGDLRGAAQARRDAGRTLVHGVKRDLGLGREDQGASSLEDGRASSGFQRVSAFQQATRCAGHSRDMMQSYAQLRNQWYRAVGF